MNNNLTKKDLKNVPISLIEATTKIEREDQESGKEYRERVLNNDSKK